MNVYATRWFPCTDPTGLNMLPLEGRCLTKVHRPYLRQCNHDGTAWHIGGHEHLQIITDRGQMPLLWERGREPE